jgi:hypothetical protein
MQDSNRCSVTEELPDGSARFIWEPIDRRNDTDLPTRHGLMIRGINERIRWRTDYEQAKRAGPPPGDTSSATDQNPASTAA